MAATALATPVRGTVNLPPELKSGRRHPGYWRIENGLVPVQPAPHRGETVVVLEGFKGQAPAARTVSVEIAGLQASPPLVVVGTGSVVELKNGDRLPLDLSIPALPSLMPLQRLAPGGIRRQRFTEPGGYLIRSAEHPHLVVSVVVVGSPHFAVVDDKGGFKLDVPDGRGALKVWSHGRWVHEEPLDVTGKPMDLTLKIEGAGAREAE